MEIPVFFSDECKQYCIFQNLTFPCNIFFCLLGYCLEYVCTVRVCFSIKSHFINYLGICRLCSHLETLYTTLKSIAHCWSSLAPERKRKGFRWCKWPRSSFASRSLSNTGLDYTNLDREVRGTETGTSSAAPPRRTFLFSGEIHSNFQKRC